MGKYCRQHIGKTFNDGKLTVVDGGDKESYVKVKCSVCAEDSELFGECIFESSLSNLNKGAIPCGCSKTHRWSLEQYRTRILRKILNENLQIEFLGFGVTNKRLRLTPVTLLCNKTGDEYTISTVDNFLRGIGKSGKLNTTIEIMEKYTAENPEYTLWDTGKRVGSNVVCGVHCKICEANDFESVFEVRLGSLIAGSKPCYCSKKLNLSADHVIEVSKRKLHEQSIESVIAIGADCRLGCWYSAFLCQIHGIYFREYRKLSITGCHCPKCNPPLYGYNTQKKGYLYILHIQTVKETVLGYGVTNKINNRLTTHKRKLSNIGATITHIQVFEGSGTAVLAVENAIKSLHTTGLLDCEGFRRESISIDRKAEVLELCKKLKQLDNPDKLI